MSAQKNSSREEARQACVWCGKDFCKRTNGGKEQMFCVQACREEWHRAKRDYLEDKLASGVITVEEIKSARFRTCDQFANGQNLTPRKS
jgi:hypothetical protein